MIVLLENDYVVNWDMHMRMAKLQQFVDVLSIKLKLNGMGNDPELS